MNTTALLCSTLLVLGIVVRVEAQQPSPNSAAAPAQQSEPKASTFRFIAPDTPEARALMARREEERRQRRQILAGESRCVLPDGTSRNANQSVTFNGTRYQCVEVHDSQLVRQGVAWVRISD